MTLSILSESEATERFRLKERLSSFTSWQFEHVFEGRDLLVSEGDLEVPGDLQLDWHGWPGLLTQLLGAESSSAASESTGLIVDGDLVVDGAVLNRSMEDGPVLLVTGSLRARHLLGGGAEIRICGDADIEQVAWGHYNDGILAVEGDLRSELVVNDDHHFEVHGQTTCIWQSDSFDYAEAAHEDPAWDEDGERRLPLNLRSLLASTITEWDDLRDDVWGGRNVLARNEKHRSLEEWRRVIRGHPERLRSVPRELVDRELVAYAASCGPEAIAHAPEALLDAELCRSCIAQRGSVIARLPERFVDREMCSLAARSGASLHELPAEWVDEDLLEELLAKDGSEVTELAEGQLNERLAAAAAAGGAGEWLPEEWRTESVARNALKHGLEGFDRLLGSMVTERVLNAAEARYGQHSSWQEVVARHQAPEELDVDEFTSVWAAHLDEAACNAAVEQGVLLAQVPTSLRSKAICKAALEQDLDNFPAVPEALRSARWCKQAVKSEYAEHLEYVPRQLMTEDLCLDSVLANGLTLRFVPDELRTVALCVAALIDDEAAFDHVPAEHRQAVLDKMIRHHSEDDPGSWHLRRAVLLLAEGEPHGALREIDEALQAGEGGLASYALRARANAASGAPDEAGLDAAVALSLLGDPEELGKLGIDEVELRRLAADALSRLDDSGVRAAVGRPAGDNRTARTGTAR